MLRKGLVTMSTRVSAVKALNTSMLQPDICADIARKAVYYSFFQPLRFFQLEPPVGNIL
jgi:hypothetical protein